MRFVGCACRGHQGLLCEAAPAAYGAMRRVASSAPEQGQPAPVQIGVYGLVGGCIGGKHTFRVSIKRVSKEAPKLYQAVSDVSGNVSACIAF